MDKTKFEKAVIWATREVEGRGWITEDYLSVFGDFFKAYEHFTGKEHPDITYPAIVKIMERMPWADVENKIPLEPSEYTDLIGAYFCDSSLECDYSISFLAASAKCGALMGRSSPNNWRYRHGHKNNQKKGHSPEMP